MDWGAERYARLYTRDTATWKLLGWQGRAVLVLLLRKLDRGGKVERGGLEPVEAVALHTELPLDVAGPGWAAVTERGVFEVAGDWLSMPNYRAAQEAKQTAAQRKRVQRERDSVTERDEMSRPVTPGHTMSLQPSLAEPSLAEPSLAEPDHPEIDALDVRAAYVAATGHADLSPDMGQWTSKQQEGALLMLRFARRNGLGALRVELDGLEEAADGWLASQPVHIWAERVGTSGRRGTAGEAATSDGDRDDFADVEATS